MCGVEKKCNYKPSKDFQQQEIGDAKSSKSFWFYWDQKGREYPRVFYVFE